MAAFGLKKVESGTEKSPVCFRLARISASASEGGLENMVSPPTLHQC